MSFCVVVAFSKMQHYFHAVQDMSFSLTVRMLFQYAIPYSKTTGVLLLVFNDVIILFSSTAANNIIHYYSTIFVVVVGVVVTQQ